MQKPTWRSRGSKYKWKNGKKEVGLIAQWHTNDPKLLPHLSNSCLICLRTPSLEFGSVDLPDPFLICPDSLFKHRMIPKKYGEVLEKGNDKDLFEPPCNNGIKSIKIPGMLSNRIIIMLEFAVMKVLSFPF